MVLVPAVVNIAAIADPTRRNHAINQSYHAFDRAMVQYIGNPAVSNWCTYGQHASREAGRQIRNLQAGLKILQDAVPILVGLSGNIVNQVIASQRIWPTLRRIFALLQEDGLMKQSLQLALAKANITPGQINALQTDWDDATSLDWNDLLPWDSPTVDMGRVAGHVIAMGIKLAVALPALIRAIRRVFANMAQGNREIYENIAPAYNQFLRAARTAPQGVVNVAPLRFTRDRGRFLQTSFIKYSEAKAVANRIGRGSAATALQQRNALMHEANLLIGFQEQLVILQPIFETMMEELTSMNGTMVINDPNGVHPLRDNWGDFYTRMGIAARTAPANASTISPDHLPPLHRAGAVGMRGTITEYFFNYLTNVRIHQAPPAIAPH